MNNPIESVSSVPYVAYEAAMARQERTIKRLWILIVILVLMLGGMFIYEAQWETVESTEITQDVNADDGGNAAINDGVHINGEG